MTNSKHLFASYIQPLRASGMTYDDIAGALGIGSSNFIGMIANDRKDSLLPLDRLPALAQVCKLTDRQIIIFALARIREAKQNKLEMSVDTFKWLLKTFGKVALSRHGIWLATRLA